MQRPGPVVVRQDVTAAGNGGGGGSRRSTCGNRLRPEWKPGLIRGWREATNRALVGRHHRRIDQCSTQAPTKWIASHDQCAGMARRRNSCRTFHLCDSTAAVLRLRRPDGSFKPRLPAASSMMAGVTRLTRICARLHQRAVAQQVDDARHAARVRVHRSSARARTSRPSSRAPPRGDARYTPRPPPG